MINLHYIRAAIQQKTGHRLSLEEVKRLLVEERIITPRQADRHATLFKGYGEYYDTEHHSRSYEDLDMEEGLPD